jgi:hypothetical protein
MQSCGSGLINPDPDTDPAFQVNPDAHEYGSGSGSRILMAKKCEKKIQLKFFSFLFLIKSCNLLIPRPPWRTSKLQEKPSALKKKWNFYFYFLFFWAIFALLDPDPYGESGSGSTTSVGDPWHFGAYPDPDRYLRLMDTDPDPTPFFIDFTDAKFFFFFNLNFFS